MIELLSDRMLKSVTGEGLHDFNLCLRPLIYIVIVIYEHWSHGRVLTQINNPAVVR